MTFASRFQLLLITAATGLAFSGSAAAQAAADAPALNETQYGAWTFFARPAPQSKKTEYTIYNSAQKTESVALMFRCSPNGLWGFIFDGGDHKAGTSYKVNFRFDGKSIQSVEGGGGAPNPVIMLRVDDALMENLAKAQAFSISVTGHGPAKTYQFENAEAQSVFLLFAHNCQE
ncbi:MAG: hypothetical protein AB1592_14905 [Pseudomonadota bacterium]